METSILPRLNVAPDDLPEVGLGRKRTVPKSVRIEEDLEDLIEDMIHNPKLGFRGHFTAFAIWALEQGVYACARAVTDSSYKGLVNVYREAHEQEIMQQHMLRINEQISRDASILEQWIKAGETDGALVYLEQMTARLERVPIGKWYKFLAHKIFDDEAVSRTLEAANAGTPKQMKRAAVITQMLEAATGQ